MESRCNVCHCAIKDHLSGLACCPHCGATAYVVVEDEIDVIRCSMCFPVREEWNRRASPWRKFSAEQPDKTLPVFVRDKSIDCYYTWPLGAIAEPRLMGEVTAEPNSFEWMAIPS